MEVLPVEVSASGIFTEVSGEAAGIQARTEPQRAMIRPGIFLKKRANGQRTGGLVSVDASGDVNAKKGLSVEGREARESDETGFRGGRNVFNGPAVCARGDDAIIEDYGEINRLAGI